MSVLQHRTPEFDVLVVHPGTYEDPYGLSGEVTFIEVDESCHIVAAINSAIRAAKCDIVHLLECGVEVQEGWTDAALRHFDDTAVGSVAPIVLDADHPTVIQAAGARMGFGGSAKSCGQGQQLRAKTLRRLRPVAPSMHAGFYRKSALEIAGMFEPKVGYARAALDMAFSLCHLGYLARFEPASQTYLALADARVTNRPFENGRQAERLIWRNAVNRSWMKTWAARLPCIFLETIGGLLRPKQLAKPLGRISAWSEWARYRRHHRKLQTNTQFVTKIATQNSGTNVRIDGPHHDVNQRGATRSTTVHVN